MRWYWHLLLVLAMMVVVMGVPAQRAAAATASSPHYGVSEVRFGTGGTLRACSTTYCAKQSAGELAVGAAKSTNYRTQAGANTDRQPFLEVISAGTAIDFGVLDTTAAKAASSTFSVKTYLASGYTVTIEGDTPKNATSGQALAAMATPALSSPGTEQFGINLRQNSLPAIGSDPLQVPDGSFSFGSPASDYNTVNYFKYLAGDTIAQSNSSSGQTVYTMSMVANISSTTGGGAYRGRLVVNVVPTF